LYDARNVCITGICLEKVFERLLNFYASADYSVVARGIMFSDSLCVRVFMHPCVRECVDFERKYLWNGWRYRQAVNGVINYNLSRVEQKKFMNFSQLTIVSGPMFIYHQLSLRVSICKPLYSRSTQLTLRV